MRIVSPAFATLDSDSLVVQDPANATATPAAGKIVVAGEDGKIAEGWLPTITSGSSFWAEVPGTPTRVSDTQFTITDVGNANSYDKLFCKGRIMKWVENSTVKMAMVKSSSYAANVVTIDLVGETFGSGFTNLKYCSNLAMRKRLPIVPGNLAVADNPTGFYEKAEFDLIKFSVDALVGTAGTTNATTLHPTDDGTSIVSSDVSIASGATSSLDNACTSPQTVIAAGSLLGIHITAVSTTPPVDLDTYLWCCPLSWRYQP
jgi:hypothetical protein